MPEVRNLGDAWASGHGIFETIRVQDKKVFALHRHHCRAKESAEALGFEIPSEDEVATASYEIINSHSFDLARLRWHFDRDGEFTISYTPFEDPVHSAKLMIFDERSSNLEVRRKEYPYRNLELLKLATDAGFDDGIITTIDGQIAETSVATLLFKIDGDWVTPPLSSGILNGVVRALTIEAGLAKVRRVELSEFGAIESALLLTSLRNAQCVAEISGRKLIIDSEKKAEIHRLMNSYKGL